MSGKICEWCGKSFDPDDAEMFFDVPYLSYDNFRICLCGECATQAIEDEVDGVYFETCEKCGATFDYVIDAARFSTKYDSHLTGEWDSRILCCDCAGCKVEAESPSETYEDDENDPEALDVYTASLIWASHGKDEDYMFGYTEKELEDALQNATRSPSSDHNSINYTDGLSDDGILPRRGVEVQ